MKNKMPKGKGDIIMKELDNKPEVAAVCDNNMNDCCKSSDTPFTRLVEEKRTLDEKIVKLYDFLSRNDGEAARRIAGFAQVEQMSEQMRVMLDYSNILNKRILTWRHN